MAAKPAPVRSSRTDAVGSSRPTPANVRISGNRAASSADSTFVAETANRAKPPSGVGSSTSAASAASVADKRSRSSSKPRAATSSSLKTPAPAGPASTQAGANFTGATAPRPSTPSASAKVAVGNAALSSRRPSSDSMATERKRDGRRSGMAGSPRDSRTRRARGEHNSVPAFVPVASDAETKHAHAF